MTLAWIPGLPAAVLMAAAIPATVSLLLVMATLKCVLPRVSCMVPVPTVAELPPTKAFETSCCPWAS